MVAAAIDLLASLLVRSPQILRSAVRSPSEPALRSSALATPGAGDIVSSCTAVYQSF